LCRSFHLFWCTGHCLQDSPSSPPPQVLPEPNSKLCSEFLKTRPISTHSGTADSSPQLYLSPCPVFVSENSLPITWTDVLGASVYFLSIVTSIQAGLPAVFWILPGDTLRTAPVLSLTS
jgi:hypothetical protein